MTSENGHKQPYPTKQYDQAFPQYTTISNGCKQFTKEKAIELLNSIA